MGRTLHRAPGDDSWIEANCSAVNMLVSVELPRERSSVPLVRHLAVHSLRELGVVEDVVDDIEIALSEVCTNVIDHAGNGESYGVEVFIRGGECEIRVVDRGRGFDTAEVAQGTENLELDRGRGLSIVRALMDQVALESRADKGTQVTLEKHLDFESSLQAL